MITSLHKKIVLALVLVVQIVKPMEQSPLQVSKFCEQAFIGEAAFAVGSVLGNLVTSDITISRDAWQKKLYFKDEVLVVASIYSGLLAGAFFVAKSMDDDFKYFIATCGHDNQQLAFASKIVWSSVVISLMQQTALIQRRTINQLRKERQLPGKVTWHALVKQVGMSDLLVYVMGICWLIMFPTAS
jgi:hypothetical protein